MRESMRSSVLGQVWRRFIEDGEYRLAKAEDFRFPAWAIEQKQLPKHEDIEMPFIFTRIGSLAIVVNTKRSGPDRFGIVLFTTDEGEKDPDLRDVVHWVYRDKDFSHSVVGMNSGYAWVRTYEEDGSTTSCDIQWSERKRRYVCVK
jgi:hypothetical protein